MANKGEWSEPYAAIRILGEGKLHIADENGDKNPNEWMNIIKLIRHETLERMVTYHYQPKSVAIEIYINGDLSLSVPAIEFLTMADQLAEEIRTGKGSFDLSQSMADFFRRIELTKTKAKSIDKSDVFFTLSDPRASVVRENIGFSIKSEFGKNPTLFNTAKASGVIYKVIGMTDALMEEINSLFDENNHAAVSERCDTLMSKSRELQFIGFPVAHRAKCATFEENLCMINPHLPKVIESMLWNYFIVHDSRKDIKDVVDVITKNNPCGLALPETKYPYMVKMFLYAAYCGMTASTLWDGKSQVNGGFIKVCRNGDVIAHYALESDAFKSYLYNSCYLEFPSTAESHGHYANVYKENGEYYFRLNFQIRYR